MLNIKQKKEEKIKGWLNQKCKIFGHTWEYQGSSYSLTENGAKITPNDYRICITCEKQENLNN